MFDSISRSPNNFTIQNLSFYQKKFDVDLEECELANRLLGCSISPDRSINSNGVSRESERVKQSLQARLKPIARRLSFSEMEEYLHFGNSAEKERCRSAPSRQRFSLGSPSENPFEETKLVRHQPIRRELDRRTGESYNRLLSMAASMGAIQVDGLRPSKSVIGGGCLVAFNIVITDQHCIASSDCFKIVFTDYSDRQNKEYSYSAVPISDPSEFAAIAEKIGLGLGPESDIHLLKILDKLGHDFPQPCSSISKATGGFSPKFLTHLGFKGGSLHVSITGERIVSASEMIKRNLPLRNQRLSWSGHKTQGVVIDEFEIGAGRRQLDVRSKCQNHCLSLDERSARKKFSNRETSIDLKLKKPIFEGDDHAIVGHKTGEGSSGGTYWDESLPMDQSLYGLHCGKIPHRYLAADPLHHFENHLVLRPGAQCVSPFMIKLAKLEAKPTLIKDIKVDPIFLCQEVRTEDRTLGYIQSLHIGKGGRYLIINTVDDHNKPAFLIRKPHMSNDVCILKNLSELSVSEEQVALNTITVGPRLFSLAQFDVVKNEDPETKKVYFKLEKKDDMHCLLGINRSALDFVSDEYKPLIKKFEEAIATREYYVSNMTNGLRNKPLIPNVEELKDIIGHTGISVLNHKRASGSDIKIYLGNLDRVVYRTEGRSLWYDQELSGQARH